MGRPSIQQARARPERLLAAAELEFARRGFAAARLEDIARRAGIRRPSLLYHYPNKDALYRATVEHCLLRLQRALLATMERTGTVPERIAWTTRAFADALAQAPSVAQIVLRELVEPDGPGRHIVAHRIVPIVDLVEGFLRRDGGPQLRSDVPIRAAIMQLGADMLLRAASGSVRELLWGTEDHAERLAQLVLLKASDP